MSWELFTGNGIPRRDEERPEEPAWKQIPPLRSWRQRVPGEAPVFVKPEGLTDAVNAALHLRRPLLLSGGPGSGKSTLVDLIAAELELGTVLRWHITSKSTLHEGLFEYDALGRLHATQAAAEDPDAAVQPDRFVALGPLGTALAAPRVRAVLIDEIDKSDLDLPGDLLNVMENGEFTIPVLARSKGDRPFLVRGADGTEPAYEVSQDGVVRLRHFPVVVFTSNGERAFPPPFLRRCIRFEMPVPDRRQLEQIVARHLGDDAARAELPAIEAFAERLGRHDPLAINQILEFVTLVTGSAQPGEAREQLEKVLLRKLSDT